MTTFHAEEEMFSISTGSEREQTVHQKQNTTIHHAITSFSSWSWRAQAQCQRIMLPSK